jgi:hypothetical protein
MATFTLPQTKSGVSVGVIVGVGVMLGVRVCVGVSVNVGVMVCDGVLVDVSVGVAVGAGAAQAVSTMTAREMASGARMRAIIYAVNHDYFSPIALST